MKNSTRLFAALSVSLLAVPVLAGCSTQESTVAADCTPLYEFPTVTEGKLSLSTYDGMPYFSQSGDTQSGIDADFLNGFAEDSCLTVEWSVNPSAAVIQSVASGRADIAAGGWYATPERGEIVGLTDPIYVEVPAILSKTPTSNVEDLVGKKVGTITGFAWVDDLKALLGEVSEYQSADAVLNDVAAGRIDYAVLGSIDAPYLVNINKAFAGIESNLMDPNPAVVSSVDPQLPNYPHTKGNDELTAALNEAIAASHESGAFAKIVETYGLSPEVVDFSRYE